MFLQKSTSEFYSKWRERRYEIFRLDVEMAGKLGAPSSMRARANQNPKSKIATMMASIGVRRSRR